MTDKLLPPDIRQMIADLQADVRRLKSRIDFSGDVTKLEVIFSRPGEIVVSESPDIALEDGGRAMNVIALAKGAGTGNSTFSVLKNGASIGTVTLGASDLIAKVNLPGTQYGPDTDRVAVGCTAAGGHTEVTVQVRFR